MAERLDLPSKGDGKAPIVSIVIPTYNRAAFIGAAIKSVLGQSYPHFELIIIDDGSTDSTAEVVGSFSDPRLIYEQHENRGRSAARNRALIIARGQYIAFLDSDDEYLSDKLERQVAYMDTHPEVGMVYTSALCIDAAGEQLDHAYVASTEGNIYQDIAFFQPLTITLPTVMLRRGVLDEVGLFDEAMERFEDTDLWRRVAKRFRVGVIESPTCKLRTHATNSLISQNPDQIVAAIEYYVAKIFREDADVGLDFLRRGAAGLYEYYGRAFISVPGWQGRGVSLLRRAISLHPARGVKVVFGGTRLFLRSLIALIFK